MEGLEFAYMGFGFLDLGVFCYGMEFCEVLLGVSIIFWVGLILWKSWDLARFYEI